MLRLVTSLLKVDPKYKKYVTIAGLLLVFGYISLLAFVFVAFNKHDAQDSGAKPHTTRGTMSLYGTMNAARDAAMELIKIGISSDAIKLASTGTCATAKKNGEADALYLSTLLTNLTKQITKQSGPANKRARSATAHG